MITLKRKRVAVLPEKAFQSRAHLFALLSELYPVDFSAGQTPGTCDGFIILEASDGDLAKITTTGADCLLVAGPETGSTIDVKSGTVRFGTAEVLDPVFRGQTMVDEVLKGFPALRLQDGDELVCSLESAPYWAMRRMGRVSVSVVALGLPDLQPGQSFFDLFYRMRWLQLLPFLNFLKRLSGPDGWNPPPLRACLMFDDPNLHGRTYGFIDFAKLAEHARAHRYHATFAMIPLDSWYVNSSAAALFQENRACLSLCMHGNDHAPIELGAPLGEPELTRMLAQGLRRVENFEKKSGVPVARVMVPPHGAFRQEVTIPLRKLGYEAGCVSRASFNAWNKDKVRPPTFGQGVAEIVNDLPVIPRHVLRRGHEGAYRLAAFLGQPIIPHGHHEDCADGLELLAHVAGAINAIGKVSWMDMTSISRSNYQTRQTDGVLQVKMFSRRINLPVAAGVREIVVERPWVSGAAEEHLICQRGASVCFSGPCGRQSPAIKVEQPGDIELLSPPAERLDSRQVAAPGLKPWLITRRLLSEVRDRWAPLFRRKS